MFIRGGGKVDKQKMKDKVKKMYEMNNNIQMLSLAILEGVEYESNEFHANFKRAVANDFATISKKLNRFLEELNQELELDIR